MIERLVRIQAESKIHPTRDYSLSPLLAAFFREKIAQAATNQQRLELRPKLALQLLQAGESEAALAEFDLYEETARRLGARLSAQDLGGVTISRALCHLRIGEQENCLANHSSESCLFPIRGSGVHKLPRGARGAIGVLLPHLEKFPEDLSARWLLNIAFMTLGEYPEKVPAAWLLAPQLFASEYDIKRFPNVAGAVGLDADGLAGGSIVEDFDGDGLLDVMFSRWNLDGQLRLFQNKGDGTFRERTAEAALTGLVSGLNIMQTDYNNDGFADVFILRGAWKAAGGRHPNSLLRNNRDGTFSDVTEEAGLMSFHPTQTATWFDFNADGWLDLFIGNESIGQEMHACELFRNNGDGTFTECASEAGVAVVQFIKGVTSGDYNNDGRPDLYLSNRLGPNILFRNDGPAETNGSPKSKWRFTDTTAQAGVSEPVHSFPTWFWDFDNDGWQDIFVAGYSIPDLGAITADYLGLPHSGERARLYRNNKDGTFADVTKSAGLYKILHAMGSNFGDLDNDGWLDFYVGTGDPDLSTIIPNRMFRNDDGRGFQEVTTSGGFGHLQKGHGVSFADLDNDGDQDIHAVMGGAFSGDFAHNAFFLNPGHENHWITLKLEGVRSNRAAIGARLHLVVATPQGDRSIYKTVGTGGSFGASPLRQEIGLGQATAIHRIEILWPATGQKQVLKGIPMDRFYKVREGASAAQPWTQKKFSISPGNATHAHVHETK